MNEPKVTDLKKNDKPDKKKALKKLRVATGLSKKDMVDIFGEEGEN